MLNIDISRPQRQIKSWVKRHPRLSLAQKKTLENEYLKRLFDKESLEKFVEKLHNEAARFERIVYDIGFGLGDSLLYSARSHPHQLIVGFDPHPNGSAKILQQNEKGLLNNILIYQGDCLDLLSMNPCGLPKANSVHIFFPDPWPKTRHHKRRLIQIAFLEQLASHLQPGGVIHIATDWADYASHIFNIVKNSPLKLLAKDSPVSHQRPLTKYEKRGLHHGHEIFDIFLSFP